MILLLSWVILLGEDNIKVVIRAAGLQLLLVLLSFAVGRSKDGGDSWLKELAAAVVLP